MFQSFIKPILREPFVPIKVTYCNGGPSPDVVGIVVG